MSNHVTQPALAIDVRELLHKPGAHKHVVVRAPLDDLATPVASETEIDVGYLKGGEITTISVYADPDLTDVLPLTIHARVEELEYEFTHVVQLYR